VGKKSGKPRLFGGKTGCKIPQRAPWVTLNFTLNKNPFGMGKVPTPCPLSLGNLIGTPFSWVALNWKTRG